MNVRRPKVGEVIRVRWIDSGADDSGSPGEGGLVVKTSYGRVTNVGQDRRLHKAVCGKRCRCDRVEFAMCSHGEGPSESGTIGTVWWPSVLSVDVLRLPR